MYSILNYDINPHQRGLFLNCDPYQSSLFLKITIHIKVGFFKVIIHIKVDFFKIMIHIKEGSFWNMINFKTQKFATYWADTLLQTPTKHPKTHQQDNSGPRKGLGGSIAPSHWVYHCPDQEERHWGKRHKCYLDYKTYCLKIVGVFYAILLHFLSN